MRLVFLIDFHNIINDLLSLRTLARALGREIEMWVIKYSRERTFV